MGGLRDVFRRGVLAIVFRSWVQLSSVHLGPVCVSLDSCRPADVFIKDLLPACLRSSMALLRILQQHVSPSLLPRLSSVAAFSTQVGLHGRGWWFPVGAQCSGAASSAGPRCNATFSGCCRRFGPRSW